MKLLILSFYYPPDLSAGSFRTAELVKQLKGIISEDDSIDIITTLPQRYSSFNVESKKYENYGNITVRRIQTISHKSGMLYQIFAFLKYFVYSLFFVIFKKYDIVYATSSRLFTGFLGAFISKIKKIPLYLDIRDIFVDTVKSVFKNSKLKFFLKLLLFIERFTINSAVKINFVSEGFLSYFKYYGNLKYSLFTNGINDVFNEYNFKKENNNGKTIVTYAGNIGEGQGLEKIIPDMAGFLGDNYEFWIIGDGGRKKQLETELKNKNINNVKLINPVKQIELMNYYKKSDYLFLHLNNYEAFNKVLPSKIFEYAATGKPIIAGVAGFPQKFIKDKIIGVTLFSPCNIEEFKEKFKFIINKDYHNQRRSFINNYSRNNIMKDMAVDLLNIRY